MVIGPSNGKKIYRKLKKNYRRWSVIFLNYTIYFTEIIIFYFSICSAVSTTWLWNKNEYYIFYVTMYRKQIEVFELFLLQFRNKKSKGVWNSVFELGKGIFSNPYYMLNWKNV